MSAIDTLKNISKAQISVGLLIAGISAAGGAALGAKLAIEKLGDKLRLEADEALQKEIADAKEFYKKLNKQGDLDTPEKALESLHPKAVAAAQALTEYAGKEEIKKKLVNYSGISTTAVKTEHMVEVAQNVFTDSAYIPQEFDYEKELLTRDPDRPYLITEAEYLEAGPDYEKMDMTYYAGDGQLANASDETIDGNWDDIVGNDNLLRFGDGSNDENIVFVRNVQLEMDYEITRSPGKYSEEVMGFDEPETELRHSSSPRKFRNHYE